MVTSINKGYRMPHQWTNYNFKDNEGAIELSRDLKYHNKTKHIDVCYHYAYETVTSNETDVTYCSSENMVARDWQEFLLRILASCWVFMKLSDFAKLG